jgi:predicted DCC family thiol-disulfide oxidoreductase YuxK
VNQKTATTEPDCDAKDKLFYDGACPLCSKEIEVLKRRKGSQITLIDVHTITDFTDIPTKETLLKNLHLLTTDGTWLTGSDANIKAWSGTKRGNLLKILNFPGIKNLTALFYKKWAEKRFNRLYCEKGFCKL